MSAYERAATAAMLYDNIQNPPESLVTRESRYNISPGASPTFVPFSDDVSRLAVSFDSDTALGLVPYRITVTYRKVGTPQGVLSVGIRKADGDTFQLIAEHPLLTQSTNTGVYTINVEGHNDYAMLEGDGVSIEYPSDNTNTIEVACNGSPPTDFTSESYDGSYSATAAALALKITSRVVTPI